VARNPEFRAFQSGKLAIFVAKKINNPDRLGEFDDKFEKTIDRLYDADFYDPDQ